MGVEDSLFTLHEIIERTFYIALLHETLKRGLTLNPEDYLVDIPGESVPSPTAETELKFLADKEKIGDKFIYIFGVSNNQSRGIKELPRITLELKAYYPGDIGLEKESLELNPYGTFQSIEYDYETKHTLIDVHLCANTEAEMRVLHDIMYRALPARGYLKPYLNNDYQYWKSKNLEPSGNFYIEVSNHYDHPDLNHGFLEKVYTYEVRDGMVINKDTEVNYKPIKDIDLLLKNNQSDLSIHVPN